MTVAAKKKRPTFTSSQLLSIWIVVISGAFTLANTALDKISAFLLESRPQAALQEQSSAKGAPLAQLKSVQQESPDPVVEEPAIDEFSTSSYEVADLKDRFDTFIDDIVNLDIFFGISLALILMGLGNLAIDLLAPMFGKLFGIKKDEDDAKK